MLGSRRFLRCGARPAAVIAALAMCGLTAGCGEGDGDRLPVYGAVQTARGERLSGSISFLPIDGDWGVAATTVVADGKYQFDAINGPSPGEYRVVFRPASVKSLQRPVFGAKMSADEAERTTKVIVPEERPYRCDVTFD